MIKSAKKIDSLSPEAEKDIKKHVPDAALVLVLDDKGEVTPLAVNAATTETKFIDRKTAREYCSKAKYTDLSKGLTFSFGSGSGWCLVDGGGGYLIWVYKP
jgi:hypothetical protein